MLKRIALLVAVLCPVFSLCPLLYSQANGSLSGKVADKTGSVIAGASVTITSQATGLTRETKTDDSGHYLVPLLPVSIYTIHVESQGFQDHRAKRYSPASRRTARDRFLAHPRLRHFDGRSQRQRSRGGNHEPNPRPGHHRGASGRPPVEWPRLRATGNPDSRHDQETNPTAFSPRRASSEAGGARLVFAFGRRFARNRHRLAARRQRQQRTRRRAELRSSLIDDIQEFKVLTYNYSAEYGTRAGPTVLVTTKSGTNQYHGSLFEFFRNTDLDAKSFFRDCGREVQSEPVWRLVRRPDSEG